MFFMYSLQSSPLASFHPMNGDTKREPFFAGSMACAGEKTSVTFVRIPIFSSLLAAVIPDSTAGILITKLGLIADTSFAISTISSASSRCGLISTETGNLSIPSRPTDLIHSAMSVIAFINGFPLSIICLGFVVTPSIPNVL